MRKITAPSINDKVTPCFGYNFLIWGCLTTKETISDTRASASWWHRGQEISPQVEHSPEGVRDGDDQPGFGHTRAAKGTIPLLVTGSKEKTPWETVPWQTWKRDLGNYSLAWCLSAKQQNYSPPAHSSSNGLFFFFFLEVLNLEDLNQRRSLADARERKHKLNQMAFTRPCKCRCCNWCTEAEPSHDSWVFSPSPHHRQLLQKELCFLWSIYTFSQQYTLLLSQATTCQITRGIALLFTTLLDSPVKERFQIWRQLAQDSYFTLQYFNKVATSWCNILLQF